jgi:hypothetical protein
MHIVFFLSFAKYSKLCKCNVGCIEKLVRLIISLPRESLCIQGLKWANMQHTIQIRNSIEAAVGAHGAHYPTIAML